MDRSARDGFPARIIDTLAKRAAQKCSNPLCRRPTSGPAIENSGSITVGVAAHITGASPGGPRYDKSISTAERASIENGIWLCQTCAKLVDSDVQSYPKSVLLEWKRLHDAWISATVVGVWSEPYSKQFHRDYHILMCVMGSKDSTDSPFGDDIMYTGDLDDPAKNMDSLRFSEHLPDHPDMHDLNGAKWTLESAAGNHDSVSGRWEGRWNLQKSNASVTEWHHGPAMITIRGKWLEINFHDDHSPYIVVAQIRGQRLVGRYINCAANVDCMPWVGMVIDNYRIDGYWPYGRWDLRR